MIFRIRHQNTPYSHVYCRLFVAPDGKNFALCGTFRLRREEFEALEKALAGVEFVEEKGDG